MGRKEETKNPHIILSVSGCWIPGKDGKQQESLFGSYVITLQTCPMLVLSTNGPQKTCTLRNVVQRVIGHLKDPIDIRIPLHKPQRNSHALAKSNL